MFVTTVRPQSQVGRLADTAQGMADRHEPTYTTVPLTSFSCQTQQPGEWETAGYILHPVSRN